MAVVVAMLVTTTIGYDGNEDSVVVVGGGTGVWVGLLVTTMVGGDGGLVVYGT
ncbi:hypothetical protein Tco_1559218, partial [Tanacetum coccineum]